MPMERWLGHRHWCCKVTLEMRWGAWWLNVSWSTDLYMNFQPSLSKGCCFFFPYASLESLRSSLAWSLPGPHHQGQIFFFFICQFAKMSLWLSVRKVLIPLQTLWFKYHLKEQGTLQKAGRCVSVRISFIPKWDFQTVLPYELLRSQKSILSVKRRSYQQLSLPTPT